MVAVTFIYFSRYDAIIFNVVLMSSMLETNMIDLTSLLKRHPLWVFTTSVTTRQWFLPVVGAFREPYFLYFQNSPYVHCWGINFLSLIESDEECDTGLSTDEEDDGSCDTEEYLAALGTRPPLPAKFQAADCIMSPVIQLFCCCTSENPADRPSAKDIILALKPEVTANNIQSQGWWYVTITWKYY